MNKGKNKQKKRKRKIKKTVKAVHDKFYIKKKKLART